MSNYYCARCDSFGPENVPCQNCEVSAAPPRRVMTQLEIEHLALRVQKILKTMADTLSKYGNCSDSCDATVRFEVRALREAEELLEQLPYSD